MGENLPPLKNFEEAASEVPEELFPAMDEELDDPPMVPLEEEQIPGELIDSLEGENGDENLPDGLELLPDELIVPEPQISDDVDRGFLDELSELRDEIAANPEGERLSDVLAQEGISDDVGTLGLADLSEMDAGEAEENMDDSGSTAHLEAGMMGQDVKNRLSDALDEIIMVSVRKAVQEEMPKLVERILKEEQQA